MKLPSLFRWFSSSSVSKRSLDAATTNRRWPNASRAGAALDFNLALIGARAESFALNNPYGARIKQALISNIVGVGIVPRPQHPIAAVKERVRREWQAYVDNADADGLGDFYAMQAAIAGDLVVYGEALVSVEYGPGGMPQLRRLHPDQLDRAKIGPLPNGGYVVAGVEFSPDHRRSGYHICPRGPGGLLAGGSPMSQRVPASNIVHVFRPLVPGQVRGLSWFAPLLLPANELDQLFDALLVRAKIGAMFVGSITDTDGSGPGMDGSQEGSRLDTNVEPGTVRVEAPGKRLEWNTPPSSGDAPALATETLRMISVGAGLTYEQVTNDYSKVNYSSARAALLEFRRFAESVQHHILVFQACRPIWQHFIRWQVLKGTISASAYQADRTSFDVVKWLPPSWPWIDPLKDTNAAVTAIKHGLRSRADVIAETGLDIEDVDRERAADRTREEQLGVTIGDGQNGN